MAAPKKPITQSSTTKNVALGTGTGTGALAVVLTYIRTKWPGVLPWSPEEDAIVIAALAIVIVPLLSRWFASKLNAKRGLLPILLCCFLLQNCVTTTETLPNGTVISTRQTDVNTLIAVNEMILTDLEVGFRLWQEMQSGKEETPEYQDAWLIWNQRIQSVAETLQRLKELQAR